MRRVLEVVLPASLLIAIGCTPAPQPASSTSGLPNPGVTPNASSGLPSNAAVEAGRGGAPAAQDAAGAPSAATMPAPSAGMDATAPMVGDTAGRPGSAGAGGASDPSAPTSGCAPRMVSGEPQLHFHHVHFNTTNVEADIDFFVKFHNGKAIDFCTDDGRGKPVRAIQTERGYFLFNVVSTPPDPKLNSFLEHVGYLSEDRNGDLRRLMGLGVKLWQPGDNLQCPEVANGMACFNNGYFYTQAPNGARIEIAGGPGPAKTGFGHIHIRGPFPTFYMQVLGSSLMGTMDVMMNQAQHVDEVNLTNAYLDGRPPENPVESKDKPISHFAYSTTDLMGHRERIKSAGIQIQEDISFKPQYGFKSFFIKSPDGVWVEIVEDSQFKAQMP